MSWFFFIKKLILGTFSYILGILVKNQSLNKIEKHTFMPKIKKVLNLDIRFLDFLCQKARFAIKWSEKMYIEHVFR